MRPTHLALLQTLVAGRRGPGACNTPLRPTAVGERGGGSDHRSALHAPRSTAFAGERWHGKCLICNGRLRFDARAGFGANVEHIRPRSLGGDNTLLNLGLTRPGCNAEKGRSMVGMTNDE